MSSSDSLLEAIGLKAHYETPTGFLRAVDEVDLSVGKSEILGIAGESACGKSTLALSLLRLLRPPGYITEGKVLFNGVDLLKLRKRDMRKIRFKHISYISQSSMNSLNPVMRIRDQITDAILTHEGRVSKRDLKKRVEELLVEVGLKPDVARMYPNELSGGMKQRVAIAMAVALRPELVVADEPTTALDVVVQRGIIQLLIDIKNKQVSSMIVITHDMAVQAEVSERLAVMYAGKIVEVGDTRSIYREPLHPYVRALISAIPSIEMRKELVSLSGLPPDLRNPPPGCPFHPRCPMFMSGKCDVEAPNPTEVNGRIVTCHLYG